MKSLPAHYSLGSSSTALSLDRRDSFCDRYFFIFYLKSTLSYLLSSDRRFLATLDVHNRMARSEKSRFRLRLFLGSLWSRRFLRALIWRSQNLIFLVCTLKVLKIWSHMRWLWARCFPFSICTNLNCCRSTQRRKKLLYPSTQRTLLRRIYWLILIFLFEKVGHSYWAKNLDLSLQYSLEDQYPCLKISE